MITIVDKNGKPTGEILFEPHEYNAILSQPSDKKKDFLYVTGLIIYKK
jgi:hypothetical protein